MLIPLKECIRSYKENTPSLPKGVIYFGNNLGNDGSLLVEIGFHNVLWMEQNKTRLPELYNMTKFLPLKQQYVCENFIDIDKPGTGLKFESFYKKNLTMIDLEKYEFVLNFMEHGTEINTLKGFGKYLSDPMHSCIKGIYTKFSYLEEMDEFLSSHGFERTLTNNVNDNTGEAFYRKRI